jgi:hypothetical protein
MPEPSGLQTGVPAPNGSVVICSGSPPSAGSQRLEASKLARRNIAFMDVTFSVQKSITVLHAAFEAEEVRAGKTGDETAAEAWAASTSLSTNCGG